MRLRLALIIMLLLGSFMITPRPSLAEDLETKAAKPLFSFKTDDREPIFGDRFQFKAGYKVWVAYWQAPLAAGVTQQINSDHPSGMNGPSFSASFKLRDSEWFNSLIVGGSWIRAGFDFQPQLTTAGQQQQSFPIRNDYNLTVGLAVYEGFGLFAGYYVSDQKFTTLIQTSPTVTTTIRSERNIQGPLFGGFATIPISQRVSFYGNAAYAILQFRVGPASIVQTDSAHGWVNEVGFNFTGPRVANIGTELQAGFRAQIIRKTFGANAAGGFQPGVVANDVTYGPIFTVNAVF